MAIVKVEKIRRVLNARIGRDMECDFKNGTGHRRVFQTTVVRDYGVRNDYSQNRTVKKESRYKFDVL